MFMAIFSKRKTIVQNIAYMAIMAAINVIFVLLTAVLPPLMFLIIFVLPLTSAIVTLFCQKKYFPIYFIVTIALCLLVTSGIYIFDTFFYVIPSLITGFLFGMLIEEKMPSIYIILICSIIQYFLTFFTFVILNRIIADINFIDLLLNIFGLSNFIFKDVFVHVFLYLLGAIQTVLTYAFLKQEIKKLGFEFNLDIGNKFIPFILNIFCIGMAVGAVFYYTPLTYIFLLIPMPLVIYEFIMLLGEKKVWLYISLSISLLISIIVFVLFYTMLPHPIGIILIAPLYALISCLYFANILFINKTKLSKINN